MLARIRKSMEDKDQGFTLIELLVVMIIIGILAAIAIPVFLNQRKKAQDSAAKADVSTIGKEVATWYVDNTAAPALTSTGTATTAGQYKIGTDVIGNTIAGVVLPAANQSLHQLLRVVRHRQERGRRQGRRRVQVLRRRRPR